MTQLIEKYWSRGRDLNPRPADHESVVLRLTSNLLRTKDAVRLALDGLGG